MMVTPHSATYAGNNEQPHDQIGLNSDHSDMVKFSDPNDPEYLIVGNRVKDLVEKAPDVIKRRFRGMKPPCSS